MTEKVRLGDICDILNGFAFKSKEYQDSGIRVIRITNVQNGYIEDKEPKYYGLEKKEEIVNYLLKEDDLLISLTGNVGRVGLLKKEMLPAALNQRVACIRVKDSKNISINYIFNILNNKNFEEQCIINSKGIAQKNLSTEWLKEYLINIPNFIEQVKISNKLDKVQDIINLRKKQIEELEELIKSQFVEMFGDPVFNNSKWDKIKMSELGILERGTSKHRPRNAPELLGGRYPLIQTGDISNSDLYITDYKATYSELGLKQSKIWNKGTLCITIAANIAQTSILTFDACFPDSVVGFITNGKVNNIFMHYWFDFFQKIIDAQATQVAQKNINLKILNNLDVIVPPIELQNQFADIVKKIDKQKLEIQKSLKEMEKLQESLMNKYFG